MKKGLIITVLLFITTLSAHAASGQINNMEVVHHDNPYNNYFAVTVDGDFSDNQVFELYINTDNNKGTGYDGGIGAEYLITYEKDVFKYIGDDGSQWHDGYDWDANWEYKYTITGNFISLSNTLLAFDIGLWQIPALNDNAQFHIDTFTRNWTWQDWGEASIANNERLPPYSLAKFQSVLNQSKLQYPNSSREVNYGEFENYSSDFFYLDNNSYMVFEIDQSNNEDDYVKRVELRQGSDDTDTWKTSFHTEKKITATLKIPGSNETALKEYTWMQIHDYNGYNKPLLRLVWRESRNNIYDHLWAAIKTNNSGSQTSWVDLGERPNGDFDAEIVVKDNKLTVMINNQAIAGLNYRDISYWEDNHDNYFKAGVYISGSSNNDVDSENRNVLVKFKNLNYH